MQSSLSAFGGVRMSDMDNIVSKFNDILKEKNIDLNKVLGDEENQTNTNFDFDLDTIIKFKNIFSKLNNANCERNTLLHSLKPFLQEERRKKLDQYIQIANLLSIIELMGKEQNESY